MIRPKHRAPLRLVSHCDAALALSRRSHADVKATPASASASPQARGTVGPGYREVTTAVMESIPILVASRNAMLAAMASANSPIIYPTSETGKAQLFSSRGSLWGERESAAPAPRPKRSRLGKCRIHPRSGAAPLFISIGKSNPSFSSTRSISLPSLSRKNQAWIGLRRYHQLRRISAMVHVLKIGPAIAPFASVRGLDQPVK